MKTIILLLASIMLVQNVYAVTSTETIQNNSSPRPILVNKDDRIQELVDYAYRQCNDIVWERTDKYNCLNLVYTFTAENGGRNTGTVSPTSDYGICQLHYTRHKDFINSPDFDSSYKQIDYCLGVWQDAIKKHKMPRYGFYNISRVKDRFILQ